MDFIQSFLGFWEKWRSILPKGLFHFIPSFFDRVLAE
jgi:hypothetical protein